MVVVSVDVLVCVVDVEVDVVVGANVAVVPLDVDFEELLVEESEEVLPPEVAIRATTMPIAKTLAIAMIVFEFVLMTPAYARRWS